MAFVAVVPAVGTGIATIGGLGSTALAGLGGLASSIPVVGGLAAPALTGLGGAVGSLGAGLGGSLMGGGLGALTGGLKGAASSLLGSGAVGGGLGSGLLGMGSGLGGLYSGADKLLGGFLPGGMTPAQGYLGQAFPGIKNMPMFGGTPNPFDTYGVKNFDPTNPFDVAQAQGLTKPTGGAGGFLGMLKTIGEKGGALRALAGDVPRQGAGVSPQAVQHSFNLQRGPTPNGGAASQRRSLQLAPEANAGPAFYQAGQPNMMTMEFRDANGNGIEDRGEPEFMSKYYQPRGRPAESSLQRL
jgi:hypothetical protein